MSSVRLIRLTCLVLLAASAAAMAQAPSLVVGVLQGKPELAKQGLAAGVTLETVGLSWSRYEPEAGQFDAAYAKIVAEQIAAFRAAGMNVQIDLGMQYPPAWATTLPGARFVNQYGDGYIDEKPGANVVNAVFNATIRKHQAAYVEQVFKDLGADFYAVRLGWNYYGEMGYPAAAFNKQVNCYWGFDANAQGVLHDRPATVKPCPVPGWLPGSKTPKNVAASRFANWYLDSLVDYQQFQIQTVRKYYKGRLPILYGSWGVRPGVLAQQIGKDLDDDKQTEMQLGYDFDRLVAAIDDPGVAVCCTWADSNPTFGNDFGKGPQGWAPVHYLAERAKAHKLKLQVWAENTGDADAAALKLTFDRVRKYDVNVLVWAFEPQLYDGKHATIDQLASEVKAR